MCVFSSRRRHTRCALVTGVHTCALPICSQKNIGPAGFTVVIVREDLLDRTHPATPAIFDYHRQNHADSLLNTPATFAIYLADLVFQWILAQGDRKSVV